MFKYILKRLGFLVLTFLIIFVVTFVMFKSLPVPKPDDAYKLHYWQSMGYDQPIMTQLWRYLFGFETVNTEGVIERIGGVFYGDFGLSLQYKKLASVWEVIFEALPPSMIVGFGGLIIGIPIGVMLGFFAAMKKNKWQDHTISTAVMVTISVPIFVYGFIILYYLCFEWGWFPSRVVSLDQGRTWFSPEVLKSLFPAMLTLSFGTIAGYTRRVRAELTEAMTSEYILLARTKGLTRGQAIRKHALKNAFVPILPGIIASIIGILNGAMITERLFSIPGIGGLFLTAVQIFDYDLLMAITFFYVLIGLATGIIIDISRGFLDPRIRVGSRKGGSY